MRAFLKFAALVLVLAGLLSSGPSSGQSDESASTADSPTEAPRDLGLEERTGRRLAQIDVSVIGPAGFIEDLEAEDFELIVAGKNMDGLFVDRICRAPQGPAVAPPDETETEPLEQPEAAPAPPASPPVSFLFYFDQPFLTMEGRVRSMQTAKELIPELVGGGNRAMVVSSGTEVTTYAKLTGDVDELLSAVDAINDDPRQWDPTSVTEELRIAEVLEVLEERGFQDAISVARRHQADERWRTARALRRFSMVLGRFAELDPPKAVVYFADRMRSRPGEHFLSYFSVNQRENSSMLQNMETDATREMHSFDRVINEANAHGVRLYTVQAEGMTGTSSIGPFSPNASSTRHITDAQNSLVGLARETGGEAFLHGVRSSKIVKKIQQDLSCLYLISFDPQGLPEDRGLYVTIRVNREKVRVKSRGQIFIQSEQARLTSRLMAAFTAPDVLGSDAGLTGAVIPMGFDGGKYTALVQVSVAGSPLNEVTWDVGASLLSKGKVREDVSGRITVALAGTRVVFETEMSFAPGKYELVLVAHDTTTNQISTASLAGSFPDPNAGPATVVPISLLQPAVALFLREGQVRKSGALGRETDQLLEPDLPTALVSLVCRGKRQKGKLRVERRLVGESAAEFPTMDLDFGDDRCAQIRDVISAGTMTEGDFAYEVQVLRREETLASESLQFFTGRPEPPVEPAPATDAAPSLAVR